MNESRPSERLTRSPVLRAVAAAAGSIGPLYLVGGSLRDMILGERCRDVDLVTEDDPRRVAGALAQAFGSRPFPLGRAPFVTWRVVAGHRHFDVWGATEGLDADIQRRDFSVNALFWRLPAGPLIDRVGGLDDLARRAIRMIDEANLCADPVRMLRAVRIVAEHPQFHLERNTARALSRQAHRIPESAPERRVDELSRLLQGRAPGTGLRIAAKLGLLAALHPSWDAADATRAVSFAEASALLRQRSRGWIRAASNRLVPAPLAIPALAASQVRTSARETASAALVAFGWHRRRAQEVASALTDAAALDSALAAGRTAARTAALRLGPGLRLAGLCGVIAGRVDEASVRALVRWHDGFQRRPPLVDGDEIARVLSLPPGPIRADAARLLREAQAMGRVRSRTAAFKLLARSLTAPSGEC